MARERYRSRQAQRAGASERRRLLRGRRVGAEALHLGGSRAGGRRGRGGGGGPGRGRGGARGCGWGGGGGRGGGGGGGWRRRGGGPRGRNWRRSLGARTAPGVRSTRTRWRPI